MYKIVLYGTGQRAKEYMQTGFFKQCDVIGFVCTVKKQESFSGKPVFSLDEICNEQY